MIYIDMDGVVSDFDQAILNIFGEKYSEKIADTLWKRTCVDAEVFRKMPHITEGMHMVENIRAVADICFLTSTGGMPHHIDIAKQKLDWLHDRGLGEHPVAFCMSTKGKAAYAYPGAVLIDDREKVCEAWRASRGWAYLFTRDRASDIEKAVTAEFT